MRTAKMKSLNPKAQDFWMTTTTIKNALLFHYCYYKRPTKLQFAPSLCESILSLLNLSAIKSSFLTKRVYTFYTATSEVIVLRTIRQIVLQRIKRYFTLDWIDTR